MRLLIITHTFPPSRHSNAKRPFYLTKGALAAGWQVEVVTSTIGVMPGCPESLSHEALTVTRVPDLVQSLQRGLAGWPRLSRLVNRLSNGGLWPDYCRWWARRVFGTRKSLAGYDRVLAFVYPPSVLLAGSYPGLVDHRWVFDYQEAVSPQFRLYPRHSPFQRWLTPRLERLERATLHQAGRVVFTAESNRQAYVAAGLVDAGMTAHVPYFYDAEVFRGECPADAGFELRYYGGFDLHGDRNPETFFRALALFLEAHPEARSVTRFVFHGHWLVDHTRFVEELKLADVVNIAPSLSYEDYLAGVRRSPVLLLVVAAAHNLFMPSKIVDYFGARRPILAFVPQTSEMRRVLEAAGMADYSCGERDAAAGAEAIGRLWAIYQAGKLDQIAGHAGNWSSEVQIGRYLEILTAVGPAGSPLAAEPGSLRTPP